MGLKKKYSGARITLVAAKTNYEIPFFEINPFIDRVIVFDKSSLAKIIGFLRALWSRNYDLGVVPSTIVLSRTSHIINWLSGAKKRVGVKSIDGKLNPSNKYLNVKTDFLWDGIHQSIRNLEIAQTAGCYLSPQELNSISFLFTTEEINFAKNYLNNNFSDSGKKVVGFHPGAGKTENIWSTENFFNTITKLYKKYYCNILLTYGHVDKPIINQLTNKLQSAEISFTILPYTIPIKKQAAILSLVDLYVTNDTGAMHIAGYAGAKMISLFGLTDPREWAPTGNYQNHIKSLDGNINSISVQQVYSMAVDMLEKTKARK